MELAKRSLPKLTPTIRIRSIEVRDCLFLVALVGVSTALYIGGLGFYSDDWAFLGLLETTSDRSYAGLVQGLHEGDMVIRQRPVQEAYLAGTYAAFGLNPLGYHAVNAAVLSAVVVLFYLVLRELDQPAGIAVAVAAVYALMPNYSTDRFWIAAHQATLSVLFLLVSTLAALRSVRTDRRSGAIAMIAVSTGALVASVLAYEITIPLFVLVTAVVAYVGWRGGATRRSVRRRRVAVLIAANITALAATITFKAEQSVRVGVSQAYDEYLRELVLGTARVDLGVYGVGLPYVLAWIFRHAADPAVLLLGVVVAGGVAAYLIRVHGSELANARTAGARYIAGGLVAMVLGYAVFVVPTALSFSSASLGNRIRIAAALGTAAVLVGVLLLVASFARSARVQAAFTAVSVGLLCGAGFVVTNTLARYWVSAWKEQREIVAHLQDDLPTLAHGSRVILDGVCLERGGAYIFTGHRDVSGVLMTRYGDSVRGSAITKPPTIMEHGLSIRTFGAPDFLRYGEKLIVYNAAARRSYRLVDRKRAEQYFTRSAFRPDDDCLPGFGWRGEAPPLR